MPQQTLDYHSPRQDGERPSAAFLIAIARRWKLLLIIAVLGIVGIWTLFARHPSERFPATAGDVLELTSVQPPQEAGNIHVASCGESGLAPGFQSLVRFEAPTSVCLQYAATILRGVPLGEPPRFNPTVDADFFSDVRWFDLDKATDLVGGQTITGRPLNVWVDRGRGVFYARESD